MRIRDWSSDVCSSDLRPGTFLICTSTYGQGDVPDNARDFIADLQAVKPDLTGKLVGIIGLGDTTYQDTFNQGGAQFEKGLQALRSEENTSELQSLMRISYAVFCLNTKNKTSYTIQQT